MSMHCEQHGEYGREVDATGSLLGCPECFENVRRALTCAARKVKI